jgi:hypothetical protein
MLQDEIILALEQEVAIEVHNILSMDVALEFWPTISTLVDLESEAIIIVDLESMGSETGSSIVRFYGKIGRPLLFIKSVVARKTTFGRSDLTIINNIETAGFRDGASINDNPVLLPIIFAKAVSGHKTTFGQLSFVITNIIDTAAINAVGNIDFYGDGLYGDGLYGNVVAYSDGLYGSGIYSGIYSGAIISLSIGFGVETAGINPEATTYYGIISRAITFTKAVAGIGSKRTSTAEISLASHGTPSVRTNHSIKVRARTTSGSTGVLKAELYEGTTLRSGSSSLVTSPLTNSFIDYTLTIPDASAATITNYSNLSIKFWGYDANGAALVFEVSRIYLELPTT